MKKKQRKLDLQPRLPHEVSTAVATSQESPPCMPLSDKVKLPVVPNIIAKDNYGLLAKSLPVGNKPPVISSNVEIDSGHKSSSQEEATPTLGVPKVQSLPYFQYLENCFCLYLSRLKCYKVCFADFQLFIHLPVRLSPKEDVFQIFKIVFVST
jgi:hypothetical protein